MQAIRPCMVQRRRQPHRTLCALQHHTPFPASCAPLSIPTISRSIAQAFVPSSHNSSLQFSADSICREMKSFEGAVQAQVLCCCCVVVVGHDSVAPSQHCLVGGGGAPTPAQHPTPARPTSPTHSHRRPQTRHARGASPRAHDPTPQRQHGAHHTRNNQGHTYTQHRRDASLMHSREPSPSRPHREEKATQT